jgi:RNA polymerase sigma-70 factor (ECF subfamily)
MNRKGGAMAIEHGAVQPYAADIAPRSDRATVEALRAGDESAFASLIDQYHGPLLRMALVYVPSHAVAEDVVQETWLGVLQGIDRFEARSSLKTWVFRILINRAKTRGAREGRSVAFSSVGGIDPDGREPSVDPDRFHPLGHRLAGHWSSAPRNWSETPEERLLSDETLARVQAAVDNLPDSQRAVITLRDIDGWTAAEVCTMLDISDANQRVLLHRARSKVRQALEQYLLDR